MIQMNFVIIHTANVLLRSNTLSLILFGRLSLKRQGSFISMSTMNCATTGPMAMTISSTLHELTISNAPNGEVQYGREQEALASLSNI